MNATPEIFRVVVEIGRKKAFAAALDWPGWCRGGRDEDEALHALLDYGPRYAAALAGTDAAFVAPSDAAALHVVERLPGNASTDFGAPDMPLADDDRPLDEADLARLQSVFAGCWSAVDRAAAQAAGQELRKGPRGGGRDLEAILVHIMAADESYLRRLAWKVDTNPDDALPERLAATRRALSTSLAAAARGETPDRGPRGGKMWTARRFARRVAWHALDHAWEIEDRRL